MQFSAVQCSAVHFSAVQCSSVQYSSVQCSAILQYNTIILCSYVQSSAVYDQFLVGMARAGGRALELSGVNSGSSPQFGQGHSENPKHFGITIFLI